MPLSDPSARVSHEVLCGREVELPGWDRRRLGMPYRYAYGVGSASAEERGAGSGESVLIKADLEARTHVVWCEERCAPGEPVFAPRPTETADAAEDDGAVLSVVYDNRTAVSFLLVLDAATFTELARCMLPHGVPAGLHGMWWASAAASAVAEHAKH